ncbi:uncharacterized protein LOC116343401 [Contarinia nasturtii]|uniref:uncharacterized protein LOC116343401 n=1 Tax=Contarinia nasturtii TaxID=265458 RepID=UPI0012D3EC5D|nr:uncharacterized protein LOC116343401 [Contarinia nasturtii]XP_031627283.1 uncharacterized protein LOC116343401 [Contarinia nasturtii]XP_031627284.1 uncharacterized protein LOC116343401 [Contarinia nasturtii]
MASNNLIGDDLAISEILEKPIENELIKVLKKRSNSNNFKFSIEFGSKKGANFMGNVYRILYEDENHNQSSLILKIAPKNLKRRGEFALRQMFLREIDMYDKVLVYFNEFQLSQGVDLEKDGFNEFPQYYSSISEDLFESVFLEDLRIRNFEMVNVRKETITFDHMSAVLKALGKFHAISFALKDQQPEKFKQLASLAIEQFWTQSHDMITEFEKCFEVLKEEKCFDLFEKIKKSVGDDYYSTIMCLASSQAAEPYAVICHGDVTSNNTMFSKDDEGKPNKVKIFDFQFTRYASPVIDLLLYLFCTITKELRDQHYEEFLHIYHDSLSDLLRRLGSDPQKLFPYEALLDQLQKFGVYSVFVGSLLFNQFCADEESIKKVEDSDCFVFHFSKDSKAAYNKRAMDMFVGLDRLGYI